MRDENKKGKGFPVESWGQWEASNERHRVI
jgi:hypothetical protein